MQGMRRASLFEGSPCGVNGTIESLLGRVMGPQKRGCSRLALAFLLLSLATAPRGNAAGFTLNYAVNQFTLTNTDNGLFPSFTNGSALSPDGGLSLLLTGGNSGSGIAGETDFFINAPIAGPVQFDWTYFSNDSRDFDFGGYLLGTLSTTLSSLSGEFGNVTFSVSQGQRFGFFVLTNDNVGEPGVLTISNFSAPGGNSLPEPGTAAMCLAGVGSIAALRFRRGKFNRRDSGWL